MARVRVEPRSCDQGRRKSDAFTLSATFRRYHKLTAKNRKMSRYLCLVSDHVYIDHVT